MQAQERASLFGVDSRSDSDAFGISKHLCASRVLTASGVDTPHAYHTWGPNDGGRGLRLFWNTVVGIAILFAGKNLWAVSGDLVADFPDLEKLAYLFVFWKPLAVGAVARVISDVLPRSPVSTVVAHGTALAFLFTQLENSFDLKESSMSVATHLILGEYSFDSGVFGLAMVTSALAYGLGYGATQILDKVLTRR